MPRQLLNVAQAAAALDASLGSLGDESPAPGLRRAAGLLQANQKNPAAITQAGFDALATKFGLA